MVAATQQLSEFERFNHFSPDGQTVYVADEGDATITPIVQAVYQQRHCSLLLNADGVMGGNPAMDISDAVVQQLNARMSTITFDRETPPAGAQ